MSTVTDPDRGHNKDDAAFRPNSLLLDTGNKSRATSVSPDLDNIGNGDVRAPIASLAAAGTNNTDSSSFSLIAPNPSASLTTRGPPNEAEIENKRGVDLIKEGLYPDAHLCFEKAVRLDPTNAKAWYNFGVSHANVTKSYSDALLCFEKAIEIDPQDAESWNNKGVALFILGRDEAAMISYARAVEIAPNNAKAWMNMMVIFEKHGNKKAAKESFKKSIEASLQI
jgi:Flp pilus assembly protein TadD